MSASYIGRHGQIRRRNGRGPAPGEEWHRYPPAIVPWCRYPRTRHGWLTPCLLAIGCIALALIAQRLVVDPGLVARLWHWGIASRRSPSQPAVGFDHSQLSRFRLWPLDMRPNEHCSLPPEVLQTLAWDDAGRSYAVLDRYRVLYSHGRPEPDSRLYFWHSGRILRRQVEVGLPIQPAVIGYQGPYVAQLNDALPADFLFLPVLPKVNSQHLSDKTVIVFGRNGLLGTQSFVGIAPHRDIPGQQFLYSRSQSAPPTGLRLSLGDSGSAALLHDDGHYFLAGSAYGILGKVPATDPTAVAVTSFYFLPFYASALASTGVTLTQPVQAQRIPSASVQTLPVPADALRTPHHTHLSP